jgi:hypothetical protein
MKLVALPLLPPIDPDRSLHTRQWSGAIARVTHKMTGVKRRKKFVEPAAALRTERQREIRNQILDILVSD